MYCEIVHHGLRRWIWLIPHHGRSTFEENIALCQHVAVTGDQNYARRVRAMPTFDVLGQLRPLHHAAGWFQVLIDDNGVKNAIWRLLSFVTG